MKRALAILIASCFLSIGIGCGREHGMYEGSQISATIWLAAFYVFSFACILGSLLKNWGMPPLLAGVFVLICCAVMLSMTPYMWLGLVLLIVGLVLAFLAFRRSRRGKEA
ncbi:MAG: hypothetical protein JW759_10715 [Candidatus Coatesbacteria bacterium]|nr:hypothetical protein [Candidatus Coatesbacteria bacterium]